MIRETYLTPCHQVFFVLLKCVMSSTKNWLWMLARLLVFHTTANLYKYKNIHFDEKSLP